MLPLRTPTRPPAWAATLAAIALAILPATAGQDVSPPTLRAAFVYTFAKFTEWPKDAPPGPFVICVAGGGPMADALGQVVAGRTVGGREIQIATPPAHPRACHVAYFSDIDRAQAARLLDEMGGAPVLTIGDGDGFIRLGGMAGLYMDQDKMRFAINPDAVSRAGLRLSSKLLGLARILRDEAR